MPTTAGCLHELLAGRASADYHIRVSRAGENERSKSANARESAGDRRHQRRALPLNSYLDELIAHAHLTIIRLAARRCLRSSFGGRPVAIEIRYAAARSRENADIKSTFAGVLKEMRAATRVQTGRASTRR